MEDGIIDDQEWQEEVVVLRSETAQVLATQTQSGYEYLHDVHESTRSMKLLDRGIITISRKKRNEETHSVNMVHGCPGRICFVNPRGCRQVRKEIQKMLDERTLHITYERDDDINMVTAEFPVPEVVEISYDSQNMVVIPLTIQMPKPFPYNSSTIVPWRYGATIITGGEEVSSGPESTVVNIADVSRMTRSGRLFAPIPPKTRSNLAVQVPPQKDVPREDPFIPKPVFETKDDDAEEFLNLIKKSDYKVVDQLLQTQSKISLLALLVHSKAHLNALIKVLKQAYIEQDATLEQFDNVLSNITVNNVLSFSKEEMEHNHALHISIEYGEDTLTNVLVDNGSSLNVVPRSTLERLSYQGATIRLNGFVVKAFDGSKCTVIGEIDLPIHIGPYDFDITFQIMDIYPAYSCLLGRPWIHSAGAVTSIFHQMMKFAVRDKLITFYGEQTIFVSHLSSIPNIEEFEAQFQALETVNPEYGKKAGASISSWKDAQQVVAQRSYEGWGLSLDKPAENNDPRPSPNFEYPVYEAGEESSEEILEEITHLLEHEEKIIEPHKEPLEVINLGTEEEKREM
ncbi:uncharacterized protein LOC131624731 [Vicia villosa]|uniref:uncharacterized protein LOC131624731 n=1 Tax=Vicia villosa TaxID=3911 RepID=UPI00273C291C|nr:uncharacterized protein LOC131624731 [Vicia villosa]